MQLFAFGVNHQTAPLAMRERVVFGADILTQALRDLIDRRPVQEAVTCEEHQRPAARHGQHLPDSPDGPLLEARRVRRGLQKSSASRW